MRRKVTNCFKASSTANNKYIVETDVDVEVERIKPVDELQATSAALRKVQEDAEIHNCHARDRKDQASFFSKVQLIAVARYLQLRLQEGLGKMEASERVAHILYYKVGLSSYKGRCIRQWAHLYITSGLIKKFKQITTRKKSILMRKYGRKIPDVSTFNSVLTQMLYFPVPNSICLNLT